jgi:hypothetical protein
LFLLADHKGQLTVKVATLTTSLFINRRDPALLLLLVRLCCLLATRSSSSQECGWLPRPWVAAAAAAAELLLQCTPECLQVCRLLLQLHLDLLME